MVAGLFSMYLVFWKMGQRFFWPGWTSIWEVLVGSSGYFLSRASLSLFTTSNAFILGLGLGNVAVGYYTIAEKIYQAYNALISPVNGVLFPHMAKNKDVAFFKRVIKWVVGGNFLLVLASLLLSSFILKFLFNTDNLESLQALRVLLLTCLITIPSILMGYPFLAAMGHPRFTNFTVMVSAVFHVCGLTLLWVTGWVSVVSVSVMVLLTELLLFVNRWLGIRKYGLLRKEGTDA